MRAGEPSGSGSRALVATAVLVAGALVAAALATGVRRVAYGALAALLVAGLGPVALVVGGFALLLVASFVVGLLGGAHLRDESLGAAGEGVVHGGGKLIRSYYRSLARVRHPVVWGFVAGAAAGTAIVWGALAFDVIPRERRTVEVLLRVRSALEQRYEADGSYPAPTESGAVPPGLAAETTDAFGRPIGYRLTGAWKIASYTLTSLGADGRPSDDDLCVAGGTRAGQWLERAAASMGALSETLLGEKTELGVRWQLQAVESARCAGTR
jgi:hypothetical protein